MSRPATDRETWYPQTRDDREVVLRELREILTSPHFCNSKRYPALLQFIVEYALAGKADQLKERLLGVEVFNRPPTYDTNSDTVVRYTAGEVRKRLLLYYHERGQESHVRIHLPAGSYVPEFLNGQRKPEEIGDHVGPHEPPSSKPEALPNLESDACEAEPNPPPTLTASRLPAALQEERDPGLSPHKTWRVLGVALAALAVVAIATFTGIHWRSRGVRPQTAMEDFWAPITKGQHTVPICAGGVIFKENNFSGVVTAGKDIDYPFVSMQIASSITLVSSTLARSGVATLLLPSPSTPLTDLREHSVVLLGAYNNQWTMRLLQSQRYQFTPGQIQSIVDRTQPQAHWSRDRSLPYSSADDYALVARFRDTTTDGWVVVLAGLGRNGTEAATQFATSPNYMELLKNQVGKDFANHNIEAVLKVSVVDGKTGAPSILAVNSW